MRLSPATCRLTTSSDMRDLMKVRATLVCWLLKELIISKWIHISTQLTVEFVLQRSISYQHLTTRNSYITTLPISTQLTVEFVIQLTYAHHISDLEYFHHLSGERGLHAVSVCQSQYKLYGSLYQFVLAPFQPSSP